MVLACAWGELEDGGNGGGRRRWVDGVLCVHAGWADAHTSTHALTCAPVRECRVPTFTTPRRLAAFAYACLYVCIILFVLRVARAYLTPTK